MPPDTEAREGKQNASFVQGLSLGPVAAEPGASRVPKSLMKCIVFRRMTCDLKLGLVRLLGSGLLTSSSQPLCIFIHPSVFMSLLHFEVPHTMGREPIGNVSEPQCRVPKQNLADIQSG